MEIVNQNIEQYIDDHATAEDQVLQKLDRETHLKVALPDMISGHVQGLLLTAITNMMKPKRILEIGTFTGYSGICLAKGLAPDGKLVSLEKDDELEEIIDKYFTDAGLRDKLELHFGNAVEIIPTLTEKFDLVFIDADKKNYCKYFDLVIDMVNPGGFIIADNVLWKGKVANEKAQDKDTQSIRDYNRKVQDDPRVTNFILPVRDGLMIAQKLQ
ncbi:O-methyltransferase [Limibacter armeniacum]|uniref:O-methyltransferase n=1 Tax=Limibacter armeniacum TaxID=466084 RepID=UPI002FE5B1B1